MSETEVKVACFVVLSVIIIVMLAIAGAGKDR
jgi:hypothetical protein